MEIISAILDWATSTEGLVNISLGTLGISGIMLTNSTNEDNCKWGPVLGLAAQPFWFYLSYTSANWGIFTLCFFYTLAWLKGLKKHWFDKRVEKEDARASPKPTTVLRTVASIRDLPFSGCLKSIYHVADSGELYIWQGPVGGYQKVIQGK